MPYHLDNADYKKIDLCIPRDRVNIFLGKLWEEFNNSIGKVSCLHNYFDTSDPEIYEYNICWSDKELPFTAELSFFNHTAKGLTHVLVAAQDYETKNTDLTRENRILGAIKTVLMLPMDELSKPSIYFQVPFKINLKLSGNYRFPLSRLLIHSGTCTNENNAYITFPVYSENPSDREHEGSHRAIQIAAALTTITQQLFTVDGQAPWKLGEN